MSSPFVHYSLENNVVTLRLDRPERRNAIADLSDCEDLAAALRQAQESRASCIVLTGAGSAFCAGGSLQAIHQRQGIADATDGAVDTRASYRRGVQRAIETLWECELPMIAAINGPAIGLGLDLACLCDIRLASEKASFASSFIRLGLIPGDGGAWILPRIIGLSAASELILTGDSIDPAAAKALGLVSRVLPAESLLPEALAMAQRIAANPAKTLRLSKRLLREGQQQRLSDVLQLSAAFQALAHETEDHREAVEAALAKRAPRFTGR